MKQVYKCDFCNFTNKAASTVQDHEDHCPYNPANKRCITCKGLRKYGFNRQDCINDPKGDADLNNCSSLEVGCGLWSYRLSKKARIDSEKAEAYIKELKATVIKELTEDPERSDVSLNFRPVIRTLSTLSLEEVQKGIAVFGSIICYHEFKLFKNIIEPSFKDETAIQTAYLLYKESWFSLKVTWYLK